VTLALLPAVRVAAERHNLTWRFEHPICTFGLRA